MHDNSPTTPVLLMPNKMWTHACLYSTEQARVSCGFEIIMYSTMIISVLARFCLYYVLYTKEV